MILNDPFLGKRVEEGNFSAVPLRDEFLENARLFMFETYCRIHRRIDMGSVPINKKIFCSAMHPILINFTALTVLEKNIVSFTISHEVVRCLASRVVLVAWHQNVCLIFIV